MSRARKDAGVEGSASEVVTGSTVYDPMSQYVAVIVTRSAIHRLPCRTTCTPDDRAVLRLRRQPHGRGLVGRRLPMPKTTYLSPNRATGCCTCT